MDEVERQTRLEYRLRHLPVKSPPNDLQKNIMAALLPERRPWFRHILGMGIQFYSHAALPLRAAAVTAALVLTFCSGVWFEKSVRHAETSTEGEPMAAAGMSDDAYFYLGRSLLASGQSAEALNAFRRAESIQPENLKYSLWQGAAYYALGDVDAERRIYQQLLHRKPDFFPARLNLAHNLLQSGQLAHAEQLYREVLEYEPMEKTALYNRALVLQLQDKPLAAATAWKRYLHLYRTGESAHRALHHLHELGDYSYRGYRIGYRTVILNQDLLFDHSGPGWDREISYLVRQFSQQPLDELNIVVFIQDRAQQAKQLAQKMRGEVVRQIGKQDNPSVRISWFGEPESIETMQNSVIHLPEGILIFSSPKQQKQEERL